MDIKSLIAEAFSGGPSSVVPTGTYSGMLAEMFGDDPVDAAENDHLAEQKKQSKIRIRNGEKRIIQTAEQKKAKRRARHSDHNVDLNRDIAVLDMETDPFDGIARTRIEPFVCELYSDQFEPIVIWENDVETFVLKVIAAIEALPRAFTIYAHNGGKFDFMFLMHRLRGLVMFKGRGLMSAKIGNHELRDSMHIIPERLANFQKEKFDYAKLERDKRHSHRKEILTYLHSDCVYLFDIVKSFIDRFGRKMSIGQAAMAALRHEYKDIQYIDENTDGKLRQFFYGGRVECLAGSGEFEGDYKLYDVNSMYPEAMAKYRHPIGCDYQYWKKPVTDETCFVAVKCFSKGAFPGRAEDGSTCFPFGHGEYFVSVHEYHAAIELKLISDVEIQYCVDNNRFTTFAKFVLPLYDERQKVKEKLKSLAKQGLEKTPEYIELKKEDTFLKLLLNNAYGKFAQNPRNFKERFLTDPGEMPADEPERWELECTQSEYSIWQRPQSEQRFNNVGTAASITGAARSILLRAIANSEGAIYCDTDSLICKRLINSDIHPTRLGAWDIEKEMQTVRIAGKKLYGYTGGQVLEPVTRCKGGAIEWDALGSLLAGRTIISAARAPTFTRDGKQKYIDRSLRATATQG